MAFLISIIPLCMVCQHAPPERIAKVVPGINAALPEVPIDSPLRAAMFAAQVAHESGEFRYVEEIADGSHYEGRKDLGNVQPGDGRRFKGRGWIMITGRSNYARAAHDLGIDLINHPELAATTENAARIACWFWKLHNLNAKADAGDLEGATRVINGGLNGLDSRRHYYELACDAFGVTPVA